MAVDVAGGGRGGTGDERFHAAVAAAVHSGLLGRMMAEISELIRESRMESLARPGRSTQSLDAHLKVADAIRDGDAGRAAAAMAEHIAAVSDVGLLREE
jgi:GntR family transcriptional regulator, transcriptional repressor for pyruvate dehydrogenase complex